MSPPPGFEESFGVGKMCKLKKSLYGLKQSPKAWFEHFGKVIKHYGYTQSQVDHTIFYKHSNEGMLGCKPAETPIELNVKLQPTKAKNSILKCLQDSKVSKGTPGRGLLFKSQGHLQIEAYTDADYARSIVDRRSTFGYRSFVDYVDKKITGELKMTGSSSMKLYCDNKVAISVAHNLVLHDRTKHAEVDKHFIKEKIDNRLVCMTYILLRNKWFMSSPKDNTRGNSIFYLTNWLWKISLSQLEGECWKTETDMEEITL
ncbi:hypothetical protein CK203_056982 [Vitis vinifera]|uniref:Reverse transcriptase Ty1/copia-type domain-containing protein n=1 Tax=Vitis vinifera TaxID=29760 RepID=A0A438GN21_VITVI|nr:hypothetical protein CK203_056982 [Vitis vinifera]